MFGTDLRMSRARVYQSMHLNNIKRENTSNLSRPESRSDPIGGYEPSSGCETKDWDSLPVFFFKTELVLVGMAHIL